MSEEELKHALGEITRLKHWVEDLQSGMYVNCIYCGHRYGPEGKTPVAMADVLKEHIEQCPEHPMSKLKKLYEQEKEDHFTCRETLARVVQGTCNLQVEHDNVKQELKDLKLTFLNSPDYYIVIQDVETGMFWPRGDSIEFVKDMRCAQPFQLTADAATFIRDVLDGNFERYKVKEVHFAVVE